PPGAALARRGIRVNGISAAAYMITSRHPTLLAECAGAGGELGGLDGAAREKLGIWATDPSLLAENSFGSEYVVPFFFSTGESDPFCCGMRAALPSAAAAGYTNNCRWVYGALQAAVASAPPGSPPLGVCIGSGGHGGGGSDCMRARQAWLDAVMASGPVPPVFPE
ncbi:MAG: hypothetical protein NZ898_16495, partial [Myxococcota bacterium]|nr:hypothetical protein [Myxococcota bacterium]